MRIRSTQTVCFETDRSIGFSGQLIQSLFDFFTQLSNDYNPFRTLHSSRERGNMPFFDKSLMPNFHGHFDRSRLIRLNESKVDLRRPTEVAEASNCKSKDLKQNKSTVFLLQQVVSPGASNT